MRRYDWEDGDIFEPTHRDGEPTWHATLADYLILAGAIAFGLGLINVIL